MLTVGIDVASSAREADIAAQFGLRSAAGVHPNSALDWNETARSAIEGLLGRPEVVAVGETGLDFYRDYAPKDAQVAAFRAHIALAKSHRKALVVHTRDSLTATLEVLDSEGPPESLIFHCWSGDPSDLERALALGAFVSFAGNASFKNAPELRDSAARVPADQLLVETDSPYLAPVPRRGKPNEPAFVPLVGAAVAAARDVAPEELAETTAANARRAFGL
jgi:TatD DNase family protein